MVRVLNPKEEDDKALKKIVEKVKKLKRKRWIESNTPKTPVVRSKKMHSGEDINKFKERRKNSNEKRREDEKRR